MLTTPFFIAENDPPSKRAILKSALALFVDKGLCETSVRDIAAMSGYTNPALFKYFKSRDDLALHLFIACYRKLAEEFFPAVAEKAGFRRRLRELLERYAEIITGNLDAFLYVTENIRWFWPRVPKNLRPRSMIALSRRLFEEGKREGAVAADADIPVLVAAFTGFLSQFARMTYFGEIPRAPKDCVDSLEKTVWRMCK